MNKSTLSKKRESKLYDEVHEQIMQCRIKINQTLEGACPIVIKNLVDNLLSDLCKNAPQKAIELFEVKNKTK